ncbi:uncharacterized protein LOC106532061, partial [Austrofundulus limnaeus]|uniref:Uncharacterized protein LOC106532061 n=1 Tax=Austrofundulus limnaeus TaxID=52670 RepID=A0A2I4CU35_AUSLI
MDASELLLSLLVLTPVTEWRSVSETSRTACTDMTRFSYKLMEGEAFYFVPSIFDYSDLPNDNVTWYKVRPEMEIITSDENQKVHSHGAALLLLNVSAEDSGDYMAKESVASGKCFNYPLKIDVFNKTSGEDVTFGPINNSDLTKRIPCPDNVNKTCVTFKGRFTWYKGTDLLHGEHKDDLFVFEATKQHEDIYTCVCTWTHYQHT